MRKRAAIFFLIILMASGVSPGLAFEDEGYGEDQTSLGQFVDSFTDTANVSVAVNVVNNVTEGLMELEFNDTMSGDNWLTGWFHRKNLTITGSSHGAVTDYPLGVKVYYGDGVDGTETIAGTTFGKVYLDSECKTDFGDIRFTEDDGKTELDYWLENKVDSDYAIFWFEDDGIPADPDIDVICMYFGNEGVSTTSNGDNTFFFFDSFDDNSLDAGAWSSFGGNDVLERNQQWENEDSPGGSGGHYNKIGTGDGRYLFHITSTVDGHTFPDTIYMGASTSADWPFSGYRMYISMKDDVIKFQKSINGAITDLWTSPAPGDYTPGTEYRLIITFLNGDIDGSFEELDGTVEDTFSVSDSYRTAGYMGVRVGGSYSASVAIWDNPFIAHFVDPEPTPTSWGDREDVPGGYEENGYFTTTDYLDYANGSILVLMTNTTIPEGTVITVEFSEDNSSWTLNDWDPLIGGFEAIDLRELNWSSSCFLRYNFTGGAQETPRLYQSRLITTEGPEAPPSNGEVVIQETDYPWVAIAIILMCVAYLLARYL